MSNQQARPNPIAPLGGVVMGIGVFLGVNFTCGWPLIPTPETVANKGRKTISQPVYAQALAAAVPPGGPYQTVCQACHQAEGQGLAGAFPPLAGSEWITADPETPIRIVLLGLTGEIEVKGAKYNATMPPPPAMTDEQIAEAITYARTNFGNKASEVTVDQVKQVRASLAGRTASWTAAELSALRTPAAPVGADAGAAGEAAAPAPPGAAPAAPSVAPPAQPVPAPSSAQPAAPVAAPK